MFSIPIILYRLTKTATCVFDLHDDLKIRLERFDANHQAIACQKVRCNCSVSPAGSVWAIFVPELRHYYVE